MYYEIFIKWLIPFVLTSIVTLIGKLMKDLKHVKDQNEIDHKAVNAGMLAIIRSRIVSMSEYYLKLGYLPDYARMTLSELMKSYTDLNGNHGIQKLAEQCYDLPPIDIKYGRRKDDIKEIIGEEN